VMLVIPSNRTRAVLRLLDSIANGEECHSNTLIGVWDACPACP
jgi:hypothetical protein